jgi:hypothetical protein
MTRPQVDLLVTQPLPKLLDITDGIGRSVLGQVGSAGEAVAASRHEVRRKQGFLKSEGRCLFWHRATQGVRFACSPLVEQDDVPGSSREGPSLVPGPREACFCDAGSAGKSEDRIGSRGWLERAEHNEVQGDGSPSAALGVLVHLEHAAVSFSLNTLQLAGSDLAAERPRWRLRVSKRRHGDRRGREGEEKAWPNGTHGQWFPMAVTARRYGRGARSDEPTLFWILGEAQVRQAPVGALTTCVSRGRPNGSRLGCGAFAGAPRPA